MPIDPSPFTIGQVLSAAIAQHSAAIVSALVSDGMAVIPHAIPATATQALREDLQNTVLEPAGIGRAQALQRNTSIRNDATAWMTGSTDAQCAWLGAMEQLRTALNRELFLGLFDYECHYAHYAPEQFYRRHRDAFANSAIGSAHSRVLSTVCYLNQYWHAPDGGQLAIFDNNEKPLLQVTPSPGTLVIFLSEQFPHEVLPAKVDRFSIAGWFRRS